MKVVFSVNVALRKAKMKFYFFVKGCIIVLKKKNIEKAFLENI